MQTEDNAHHEESIGGDGEQMQSESNAHDETMPIDDIVEFLGFVGKVTNL